MDNNIWLVVTYWQACYRWLELWTSPRWTGFFSLWHVQVIDGVKEDHLAKNATMFQNDLFLSTR